MADRYESGVLDTCAYIDLNERPCVLAKIPEITAITMAELQQGVDIEAKKRDHQGGSD